MSGARQLRGAAEAGAVRWGRVLLVVVSCAVSGCAPARYDVAHVRATDAWLRHFAPYPAQQVLVGEASYYHDSLAGNLTANGEIYDPQMRTAAHRTLPFGTVVRVVRQDTGDSVIVRVNDRGPFGKRSRILDLSRAAAEALNLLQRGVAQVRVEILHRAP